MDAGTKYRGEFEEKLDKVLKQLDAAKGYIIPVIDEVHLLTKAGASESSEPASQAVKAAMARGKMRLVGATTQTEYDNFILPDAALHRRFAPVIVNEPDPKLTNRILQGSAPFLEGNSGIRFTNDALNAVQELSARYIVDRFQPAKSIEVAAQTIGRMSALRTNPPRELSLMRDEIGFMKNEYAVVSRESSEKSQKYAKQLAVDIEKKTATLTETETAWKEAAKLVKGEKPTGYTPEQLKERFPEMFREEVIRDDVAKTISDRLGIPVGSVTQSERDKLVNLEKQLGERVKGQDHALELISRAIRRGRTGISDPNRPVANIMILGGPGIGKTETAKAAAKVLFETEEALNRFNMGEYGTPGSRDRLVNDLSDAMRRRPYSVVLLDEIEKANPEVYDSLMTALGEGKLMDTRGRKADLSNAVVLLSSNMKKDRLPDFFRREFIDRMDDIVEYNPLTKDVLGQIATRELDALTGRLNGRFNVEVSAAAKDLLVERAYAPDQGARQLKRVIERTVGDAITNRDLDGTLKQGWTLKVGVREGEFTFTPVKPDAK
jgi:ATP-dependent Clp protease ATP-binding subunit ClpB